MDSTNMDMDMDMDMGLALGVAAERGANTARNFALFPVFGNGQCQRSLALVR